MFYICYNLSKFSNKEGDYYLSKKEKEFQRLLHKKTLSSDEAIRLVELDGWYLDPISNKSGTSHLYFRHKTKSGKVTIPANRKTIHPDTLASILKQAGLY